MKYDPLYLFENKRNRFDKFVRRAMGKAGGASDQDVAPAKASVAAMPQKRAPQSAQAARQKKPAAAAAAAAVAPDLISMQAAVPDDGFGGFTEAPTANMNDGFGGF